MSEVVEQDQNVEKRPLLWIAVLLAVAAFVTAILVWLWRRWQRQPAAAPPARRPLPPPIPDDIKGLTQAEAEARRLEGQDNAIYFKPPRTQKEIWRENVYTIFNFSLVGLAIAQVLLGQYLGALTSLGTILLNIGLNIGQEYIVKRRLRDVEKAARPKATVVRESRTHSIDTHEIVQGDMLVAGPGDQLFVDGEIVGDGWIVVDESMLTGDTTRISKRTGDTVYAGSFCVAGRAVYEAKKVGKERLIATRIADSPDKKAALTPLERIVERVLWILLSIVAVYTILLLVNYFRVNHLIPIDAQLYADVSQMYADAASVIFGIAPASLYFMIVLAYAAGTADLGQLGALVHRARSVESLAQASVVCFAQAGILTGTHVEVEAIEQPEGREQLAESRIRQIAGDIAHNTSADNVAIQAMRTTFEGTERTVQEEAPFLSVYGWSAVAFDEPDLRGIYVLGHDQVLEPYLVANDEPDGQKDEAETEAESSIVRRAFSPLGRLFGRSKDKSEGETAGTGKVQEPESQPKSEAQSDEDEAPEPSLFGRLRGQASRVLRREDIPAEGQEISEDEPMPNLFRRLGGQVGRLLQREEAAEEEDAPDEIPTDEAIFMLAYQPELAPLHSVEGVPQLPEDLIPLCKLHYTEKVRPEAIETIKTFSETGVGIKVFTARSPERTLDILQQAEMGLDEAKPLGVLTGPELAEMDAEQLAQAVGENTVFSQIAPEQAGLVVRALREHGESVAVVGDRVNDLPAMRQADLAIARQSSNQAALSVADIILLSDSPQVLQTVLDKGQRIVHGLLDVLRLNLTQVIYIALLIAGLRLVSTGFPFHSGQVTVINLATVALPSAALTLWAAAGLLTHARFGRLLTRFMVPAAITMTIAGMLVYMVFLEESGDMRYAQLALTYTLVLAGLLLVLFVKQPIRLHPPEGEPHVDWRVIILVLVVLAIFLIASAIPLAQEHLKVGLLEQPEDYLTIGVVVLVWAVLLRLFWFIAPLDRNS
jgi:magnesium-transporting ATPase (P-type)